MAAKSFVLSNGTTVLVTKRRSSRNLRLTISSTGEARISVPFWTPYKTAVDFAEARAGWILLQMKPTQLLEEGLLIGKNHSLHFSPQPRIKVTRSRLASGKVVVLYPSDLEVIDPLVQAEANAACIRALRKQAKELLPDRLVLLADRFGFTFNTVAIKQMKSRWGSCDQHKNIVCNLFLMELPWKTIDYVLVHELSHTEHLNHSADFWARVASCEPNHKEIRRNLRQHKPVVNGG
jgi:predicted metal-dependent hydrolase